MTADEYRIVVRELGLTPSRPSYEGATIHVDREGEFHSIPNPETLTPAERVAYLGLLKFRLGISNN